MKNLLKSLLILLILGTVACESDELIAPTPPNEGSTIEPEIGGPDQPNQVFVDFSTNTTTVSARTKWDLGFATGAEFSVAINYSAYMSARPTDQTDLAQVSSNLVTEDYKTEMATGPECNVSWVDNPSGDLSQAAIGEISSTDSDNVVFVVNRGYQESGSTSIERGHVKVRITRDANNYIITYGNIDDDTFTSTTITKDPKYNFVFFSFDNGIVQVEPEKENWDIVMTTGTTLTAFGPGAEVPYNFKDLSFTNFNNAKIATVDVTGDVSYNTYTLSDAQAVTLENNRTMIGSSWRVFNGDIENPDYNVNEDSFYIIEDSNQNLYKLKFTRLKCAEAACAGQRGYPEFAYELLK